MFKNYIWKCKSYLSQVVQVLFKEVKTYSSQKKCNNFLNTQKTIFKHQSQEDRSKPTIKIHGFFHLLGRAKYLKKTVDKNLGNQIFSDAAGVIRHMYKFPGSGIVGYLLISLLILSALLGK